MLVDSFLVSAKSIPHLQFTYPLPTTPSIIKPIIAAIIACTRRCYVENKGSWPSFVDDSRDSVISCLPHICCLLDKMPTIASAVAELNHRCTEFTEKRRANFSIFIPTTEKAKFPRHTKEAEESLCAFVSWW
jgi:hypothetical protein